MNSRLILLGQFNATVLSVPLDRPQKYLVGRSSTLDIVVSHPSVSRTHAELCHSAPGIAIKDLGSRNGTFVENDRITAANALPGQRIRFGEVAFLLAIHGGGHDEDSEEPTDNCGRPQETTNGHKANTVFTPAQTRVFDLLVLGFSEKELACRLGLSTSTVHHHIGAIYRAMGVSSRAEFLVRAHPQWQSTRPKPRRMQA